MKHDPTPDMMSGVPARNPTPPTPEVPTIETIPVQPEVQPAGQSVGPAKQGVKQAKHWMMAAVVASVAIVFLSVVIGYYPGARSTGTAPLWDVASGRDEGEVGLCDLASGGPDGTVRLWNTATGQQQGAFNGHNCFVHSLAFSPDGRTLASGGEGAWANWDGPSGEIRVWNVATQHEQAVFKGHTVPVLFVAFSPDGQTLVSADNGDWDNTGDWTVRLWNRTVRPWNKTTGEVRAVLRKKTFLSVLSVTFIPAAKALASVGQNTTVGVWGKANSVAVSRDGKLIAWLSCDETVHLWDVVTGQERALLRGHTNTVSCVAFSRDDKILASGSWGEGAAGCEVRLWDMATCQERAILKGHTGPVNCVAFNHDGKILASGSWDGMVRLWDVATGQERAVLKGHTRGVTCVAFSGP